MKVSYAGLKLKVNEDVDTFEFQGQTIEVLKYLNSSDKYDLIMITLQKAKENGLYNPFKLDVYFHLHLVYMYTNLSFTEKQREDEFKIYDCLKSNGFIDKLLGVIDENEYDELIRWIDQIVDDTMHYKNSAAAVIQSLVNDLPANAEAAAKIVDNFNPEQYQAVVDFVAAANGGRPVNATKSSSLEEIKKNKDLPPIAPTV